MQWWGYSKEHGWVVLDQSIPSNAPGIEDDLLFFRCRDATTFVEEREKWSAPLYVFAPNYLRGLTPPESVEAAADLEALKSLWPQFRREIQREHREAEERDEAIRVRQEAGRKPAARGSAKKEEAGHGGQPLKPPGGLRIAYTEKPRVPAALKWKLRCRP